MGKRIWMKSMNNKVISRFHKMNLQIWITRYMNKIFIGKEGTTVHRMTELYMIKYKKMKILFLDKQ